MAAVRVITLATSDWCTVQGYQELINLSSASPRSERVLSSCRWSDNATVGARRRIQSIVCAELSPRRASSRGVPSLGFCMQPTRSAISCRSWPCIISGTARVLSVIRLYVGSLTWLTWHGARPRRHSQISRTTATATHRIAVAHGMVVGRVAPRRSSATSSGPVADDVFAWTGTAITRPDHGRPTPDASRSGERSLPISLSCSSPKFRIISPLNRPCRLRVRLRSRNQDSRRLYRR